MAAPAQCSVEASNPFRDLTEQAPKALLPEGQVATQKFLTECRRLLPILEKLGLALALVRSDISGNIERLSTAAAKDEGRYSSLFPVLLDEVARGQERGTYSETRALLWLRRALLFVSGLLALLERDRSIELSAAASQVYTETLYPFHSWATSMTFTLALKCVPSRASFLQKLGSGTPPDELLLDMRAFVQAFQPVLDRIGAFLTAHNLDFRDKV